MIRQVSDSGAAAPRRNPVIRLLSSVWFGIFLMVLILIYASVASALPQVRGAVEMTEMQIFNHWVFGSLIGLFCLVLSVATWTRIRWNVTNLGVLTVHAGLLILAGGSYLYFSGKVEGDTPLISPRVELVNVSAGASRVVAEVPAQPGESWSRNMPAFGGPVSLLVKSIKGGDWRTVLDGKPPAEPISEVTVSVQLGEQAAREFTLSSADGKNSAMLDGRLAVRFRSFPPQSGFYDQEHAALYLRKAGESQPIMLPVEGLPIYRERYLDDGGGPLLDSNGQPMPSKRVRPEIAFDFSQLKGNKRLGFLAGLGERFIPTGWFEHWRLPIDVKTPAEVPFDIQITGYIPYYSTFKQRVVPGGQKLDPAAYIKLSDRTRTREAVLFALRPAEAEFTPGAPVEFRWVEGVEQREKLLAAQAGAHELEIELRDPPLKKVLAIDVGQVIKLDEAGYELKIADLSPSWPLMTPGYENARSAMASVDVTAPGKKYNRTVIQRYPELSQDIDETGKRHKDGPYDPNLVLRYRSAASARILIVAGPGMDPEMGVFATDGTVERYRLAVGVPQPLGPPEAGIRLELAAYETRPRVLEQPVVEALERRRPGFTREVSAIRMELKARDGSWSETRWCTFSSYPDVSPQLPRDSHLDATPLSVRLPDGQAWEIIYSRLKRDLGATLIPGRLTTVFFPGKRAVESWRSDFFVDEPDRDELRHGCVYTNQTHNAGGWTLFQSGAARDHWGYTVLGVGNRRGIWPMVLGCILIPLGSLYAFYVKPWLIRRRQQAALVAAAEAGRLPAGRGAGRSSPQQLVESR